MRHHVRIWILAVLAIIVVGAFGYVLTESWSLEDGLYMTVTTITTVGFKEVHPLDEAGRIWTMLLSIAGVAIIFGSIGLVAESILSEVASGRREERRMTNAVAALKDHFILCGYGRVGGTVSRELAHAGVPFVIIDINAGSLETALRDGYLIVEGDATQDEILRTAGIDRARGLITTIDSDANNVYVTLSARALKSEAVHRRAGERGRRRGKGDPGGRGSRRVALYARRPADRRAWRRVRGSPTSSTSPCPMGSWPSRWRRSKSRRTAHSSVEPWAR